MNIRINHVGTVEEHRTIDDLVGRVFIENTYDQEEGDVNAFILVKHETGGYFLISLRNGQVIKQDIPSRLSAKSYINQLEVNGNYLLYLMEDSQELILTNR